MTVQELIDALNRYAGDTKVVFVSIEQDVPSIDSYTIDEVKKENGFVQLISID